MKFLPFGVARYISYILMILVQIVQKLFDDVVCQIPRVNLYVNEPSFSPLRLGFSSSFCNQPSEKGASLMFTPLPSILSIETTSTQWHCMIRLQ